jgi:cell division protein FtsI (penicillin-binding protein 3)
MADNDNNFVRSRQRIALVFCFFFVFFCGVVYRAYQLQILGTDRLNQLAQSQHVTRLIESPRRGTIYDRNGNVLALDILMTSVGIHPQQIEDKEKVRQVLLKNTDVTSLALDAKFSSSKKFEYIQRRIPLDNGLAIEKLKLKGIQIEREYRRYYPNKTLAGQVLGAVGYDAKALGGIELTYDKYLRTEMRRDNVERDARGRFFSPLTTSQEAKDIYLSLDKNIQAIAEDFLKENAIKHKVETGFAIVLDVKTGEVLAMANYPEFNPNRYSQYPLDYWKNHAALDVYEPGSTFKAILMASALDSGLVKPTDRFFCENGSYKIGSHVINDHVAYGLLDVQTILQVSSNIGTTKVAQKIGRETFFNFIQALGFGAKTDIGFLGESSGSVRHYKSWREIEFSNMAFGQGLSVTGLQMAKAYAAMANGGHVMKPILVKSVIDMAGDVVLENLSQDVKTVTSPTVAKQLGDMLHLVTQPGGTAAAAHIDGYHAGGKTGTAQKYNSKTGTYDENNYVSSFIGFAPQNEPRILVYVVYDSPHTNGYYGGVVAAPVFKNIAENTLNYLGVVPVFDIKKSVKPLTAVETKSSPKTDSSDVLLMALKNNTVPNFQGLPLRKVLQLMAQTSVKIQADGSGWVVTQEPKPGSALVLGGILKIKLSNPS